MKLQTMTNFVLEQHIKGLGKAIHTVLNKIFKYAVFLNQPLTLGMFVPCDEDGNRLIKPEWEQYLDGQWELYQNDLSEYANAKERILFEGFKIIPEQSVCCENNILNVFWKTDVGVWRPSKGLHTIEDLVKYNLTLTKSAVKQLGL